MIEPKQIIRRKRKSLALTINEEGELIVFAPKTMPLYEIIDFIQKNKSGYRAEVMKLNRF